MGSPASTPSSSAAPPQVTVRGYSHVNVLTRDADRAQAFYRDVLGFSLLPRPDFGIPGAWLQHGTAQVHLSVVDDVPERVGRPHLALMIPPEAFADTCAALDARGVPWLSPPRSRVDFGTEVWAAFIEDPDGNVIELTTAGPQY